MIEIALSRNRRSAQPCGYRINFQTAALAYLAPLAGRGREHLCERVGASPRPTSPRGPLTRRASNDARRPPRTRGEVNAASRSRDIICPRFAWRSPQIKRGRREDRVRAAPAVSRAKVVKKSTRAYRFSGSSPAFPAQWFYGLFRALPGETRLVCHRRPQEA